jgi:hypothetical protein
MEDSQYKIDSTILNKNQNPQTNTNHQLSFIELNMNQAESTETVLNRNIVHQTK